MTTADYDKSKEEMVKEELIKWMSDKNRWRDGVDVDAMKE